MEGIQSVWKTVTLKTWKNQHWLRNKRSGGGHTRERPADQWFDEKGFWWSTVNHLIETFGFWKAFLSGHLRRTWLCVICGAGVHIIDHIIGAASRQLQLEYFQMGFWMKSHLSSSNCVHKHRSKARPGRGEQCKHWKTLRDGQITSLGGKPVGGFWSFWSETTGTWFGKRHGKLTAALETHQQKH